MKTYKTEGIIIKRINFGEADRILTIFTKHYGKIKAIAKGIRKIKSRRAPHLELFNQTVLFLYKGKNLDIITEAQLVDSFSTLRKNLRKVAFAFGVCELVDQLTREGQKQLKAYELLKACLNDLNHQSKRLETQELSSYSSSERSESRSKSSRQARTVTECADSEIMRNFEIELLQVLGFLPKGESLEKVTLERYIEKIIEKKLKSRKFLSKL